MKNKCFKTNILPSILFHPSKDYSLNCMSPKQTLSFLYTYIKYVVYFDMKLSEISVKHKHIVSIYKRFFPETISIQQ